MKKCIKSVNRSNKLMITLTVFILLQLFFRLLRQIKEPRMEFGRLLKSQMCTKSQFFTKPHLYFMRCLKETPKLHRKQWEYTYILKALQERGFLVAHKKGIGIGVGTEPLPAYFVSRNISILATDNVKEAGQSAGWNKNKMFLSSKKDLNSRNLAKKQQLKKFLKIEYIDAFDAVKKYKEEFDFIWSTCVIEHFGGIAKGLSFLVSSLNVLKPGGISVHTMEFNIHSNDNTLVTDGLTIFRKRDIEQLAAELRLKK